MTKLEIIFGVSSVIGLLIAVWQTIKARNQSKDLEKYKYLFELAGKNIEKEKTQEELEILKNEKQRMDEAIQKEIPRKAHLTVLYDRLKDDEGNLVTYYHRYYEVVYAKAGTVHLIERTELSDKIDNNESCIWLLTQQLTQAMATGGVEACAKAVFMMLGSNAERAKDLAYRLYTIAEQKKWASEAFAYNALVVAWPDIQSRAAMLQREIPEQLDMFNMGLLDN